MIYQRVGEAPEDVWALPRGRRAFRFASMMVQLEDEQQAAGR